MISAIQEELLEELEEQGVEITETPVYLKCYIDIIVKGAQWEGGFGENDEEKPQSEEEWLEFARDIAECDYSPEDLFSQFLYEAHELSDLGEVCVVDKSETSSPDWCYEQDYFEEDEGVVVLTTVEFYVEVSKKDGEYSIEVVD